jgi:hypothetical protein
MSVLDNRMEQASVVENRMWSRLKCKIATQCFSSEDRWSCIIVDLSERGLGIVSSAALKEEVVVNFNDPVTRAKVVWVAENSAGLKVIN